MSGRKNSKPSKNVEVGSVVMLRGTGGHWSGVSWHAKVVDVRGNDPDPRLNNSIKVQYGDGGYKRFSRKEFYENLVTTNALDEVLAYGEQDYDWDDEHFSPSVMEANVEILTLKEAIQDAVNSKDFKEAAQLKKKLDGIRETVNYIKAENRKLVAAIQLEDYEAAEKINANIEKLQAQGRKKTEEAGVKAPEDLTIQEILDKATARAFRGGLAGMGAMVIQVTALMWMRTTMNYQYRHGTSTSVALKTLYKEGGVRRFYRGLGPALFQGPLSRFGDTAANVGMLTALNASPATRDLPVPVKTVGASLAAACWRIFLMPIDTTKTILQVEGKEGLNKLKAKFKTGGPRVMYHGALGACSATFAGHFPWYGTYNTLNEYIPHPSDSDPNKAFKKLARNAGMGFCASFVSDCTSNSIRVLKTYRQTSEVPVTYPDAAREIIKRDGLWGLFGRGLQTRIMSNGVQGMMFSVLWRYFSEQLGN